MHGSINSSYATVPLLARAPFVDFPLTARATQSPSPPGNKDKTGWLMLAFYLAFAAPSADASSKETPPQHGDIEKHAPVT